MCVGDGFGGGSRASVDGLLNDWGVTINSTGHLVYDAAYGAAYDDTKGLVASTSGTNVDVNGRRVTYQIEDSNDYSNGYQVGPLWGGQNYDAEALLVSLDGGDLHIAIATGQRPDNRLANYAPGDISIVSGGTTWGIEVGGGAALDSGSANFLLAEGSNGTTYTIKTDGYTLSSASSSANQTAGSIWLTDGSTSSTLDPTKDWQTGIANSGTPRPPTQLIGGTTRLGQADYAFNFGVDPNDLMENLFGGHAFIELVVEDYYMVFGDLLDPATVRWSPVCGNDQLMLSVTLPPKGVVPEPTSLVVWTLLIGAAGWVGWRRKRV